MALKYPLEQVLTVKKKRVEDAEKLVQEKRIALEKEQQKLKEREAERDKVKNHYKDKLGQLRAEMDHQTTTTKIQQMKAYLKVVIEKLKVEEKKVSEQIEQVKIAEKNLEAAREELNQRRREVDKMETHKKDWTEMMLKEEEIVLARDQDELGSIQFVTRKLKSLK